MSLSTILETMDTTMIDFNEDADIPMGMGPTSAENWFLPVAHMDEDGQMQQEIYSHTESLEVDMAEYEETAEYEMDEAASDPPVVDAEVLDVSFSSSPVPPVPQDLENIQTHAAAPPDSPTQNLPSQPPVVEHAQPVPVMLSQPDPEHSDGSAFNESHVASPEKQQEITGTHEKYRQDAHSDSNSVIAQDHSAAEQTVSSEESHPVHVPDQVQEEQIESAGEAGAPPPVNDGSHQTSSIIYEEVEPPIEHAEEVDSTVTSVNAQDPQEALLAGFDTSHPLQSEDSQIRHEEESLEESRVNDSVQAEEVGPPEGYHEFSGEEQFDSPSILLKLRVRSSEGDQPDFALFKLPDNLKDGDQPSTEEPLVLLQHHQELFYEPISSIFEAFRHEEYFTHLEEFSNAEMLLSAPELQLDVSEDNIYAREVSLHDLVAMHQGLGLPGHLELTLQSVVPRFITRYNQLREQITKLAIGETIPGEPELQESSEQDSLVANRISSHQAEVKHVHPVDDTPTVDIPSRDANGGRDEESSVELVEKPAEVANAEQEGNDENDDAADEIVEHAGIQDHDDAPYSDEATDENIEEKEEDSRDELDADRIHNGNDAAHKEDREEERQTEYFTEVAPEDDDDGYAGEGFEEDQSEESVGGDVDNEPQEEDSGETTSAEDGEGSEVQYAEPADAQAQLLSFSTSTTSRDTDAEGSGQDDGGSTVRPVYQTKKTTDDTSKGTTDVTSEEGNLVEGEDAEHVEDEFGDEVFEDDDFGEDGATEETLDESPNAEDEAAEEFDRTTEAILAESQKFVAELGADVGVNNGPLDAGTDPLDIPSSEDLLRMPVGKDTSEKRKVDEFITAHKNTSKRSLDDTGFEEADLVSPPSSPDSKRARKL